MPVSGIAEEFSKIFRDEHRGVRDGLFNLIHAAERHDVATGKAVLGRLAQLSGPHFRYEEESLYPALAPLHAAGYVDQLIREHDHMIGAARQIGELLESPQFGESEASEVKDLARSILPHVSDCDGLAIMMESVPEGTVSEVLETRAPSRAEGIDLLRWAEGIRQQA